MVFLTWQVLQMEVRCGCQAWKSMCFQELAWTWTQEANFHVVSFSVILWLLTGASSLLHILWNHTTHEERNGRWLKFINSISSSWLGRAVEVSCQPFVEFAYFVMYSPWPSWSSPIQVILLLIHSFIHSTLTNFVPILCCALCTYDLVLSEHPWGGCYYYLHCHTWMIRCIAYLNILSVFAQAELRFKTKPVILTTMPHGSSFSTKECVLESGSHLFVSSFLPAILMCVWW